MSSNPLKFSSVSVVVPTFNEVENVRPLTERLFAALSKELPQLEVELVFVDDESSGSDETEKIVRSLASSKLSFLGGKGYPVRIERRWKSEGRGLSSAVMLGFEKAKHEVVLSMDADLQHEPESVPAVLLPVLEGNAEFTVGCR